MNNKKFRHWDNIVLFTVLENALQFKEQIESMCVDGITPDMLPPSVIQTSKVYDIVACYAAMYDKLMEHDLVDAGYPKTTIKLH